MSTMSDQDAQDRMTGATNPPPVFWPCPAGHPGPHVDFAGATVDVAKAIADARAEGYRAGRDDAARAIEDAYDVAKSYHHRTALRKAARIARGLQPQEDATTRGPKPPADTSWIRTTTPDQQWRERRDGGSR